MMATHQLFSLAGRTALVTGSGRNVGKEIAVLFATFGANVIVNGHRDKAALAATVDEITAVGGRAVAIMADVSISADVNRLVAEGQQAFGSIDIVVSNVGVRKHKPLLAMSDSDWHSALNQNLNAAFYLARAALPKMIERKWGRFVLISGLDAFSPQDPERAHIIVSKLGLHGLAKALAIEFGPHGITANTISPGLLATDRDWSQFPKLDLKAFSQSLPLRRIGKASDVASAALYLSSEAGSFVTGQTIHINGGQRMF